MGLTGLALLLLAGLGVALAAAVGHTLHTLRHPPRRAYAWALARGAPSDPSEVRAPEIPGGLPFESWPLRSRGADLPVWDVHGLRPDGPVIIFTHGWGESRTVALARLPHLAPLASRIILWDLPGHGDAGGVSTLGAREADDLLALIDRLGQSPPIVLYGDSLGAGISIAAAAAGRGDIAAVVAEAPYRVPIVPARNVLRAAALPWRIPLPIAMAILGLRLGHGLSWASERYGTPFDRARLAANVGVPLLVLHGENDAVSPIADGRAIAAAAPRGAIAEIPGAGHLDIWTTPESAALARAALAGFIDRVASPAAATPSAPPAGR